MRGREPQDRHGRTDLDSLRALDQLGLEQKTAEDPGDVPGVVATAMSFANPTDSYLDDLVTAAPAWYVAPIVMISLLGGLSQGVLCIYASGLDLEGLAPQLKRTQTTIITAAAWENKRSMGCHYRE